MEQHKDFPDFWAAFLMLALLVGLKMILAGLAYDLGFRFEAGDPAASSLITIVSCGMLFSLLMSYKNMSYKSMFYPSPVSSSAVSIIMVLLVPIFLTVGGGLFWIADITSWLLLFFPAGYQEQIMLSRLMSGGIISIIAVCVVAPLIEEMLFRGIILRSFLVNYPVGKSILLSSLLFALFHLTVSQLPVAFILGCLFGWLYVQTRSLWASILGHMVYNSCAMIYWSNRDVAELAGSFHAPGTLAVSVLLSSAGLMMLMRILGSGKRPVSEEG